MRSVFATLFAALIPVAALAQEFAFQPRTQLELRADGLAGPPGALQFGAGANVPAGWYVRLGATLAAGPAWRDGRGVASARADVAARFLLDPFKEFPWSAYAGGGLTTRWNDPAGSRGYLLFLLGVEGPEHGGWRTAVEAALGGGARLGVVLRRARSNGR